MARSHALLRLTVRPVCSRQHFVARRAASSESGCWKVLGIETSADDTCLALMEFRIDNQKREMGKVCKINKVTYDNKKHGGIHPVEAVESHTKSLARMVSQSAWLNKSKPDLICVTRGPGMGGCLSVGVTTAKALSAAWKLPIIGVHHMQAHALTCAMEHTIGSVHYGGDIAYPFLTLLVSGKHTMLVHTKSPVNHRILARSETIALGDALDKIARELVPSSVIESQPDDQPICYPLLLEQMTIQLSDCYVAAKSRKDEIKTYKSEFGWALQPPLQGTRAMKYEFNGLASQTRNVLRANPEMTEAERQVLGTQCMRLAFEHLVSRVILALETDEDLLRDPPKHLILSGGVASNMFLRTIIHETLKARGHKSVKLCVPSPGYCTDNAAMIAYAGWKMFLDGWTTDLDFCPAVKWSIEEILTGADCWTRRDGFPPMTPEDAQREFAGPSLVINDVLNMAQDPLSSDTKQEDGFPGESLFFPNGSHTSREDAQPDLAGPSLATTDVLNTAQAPLSSDTKQEDAFPGESLFFPSGSHTSHEMAELPEDELEKSDPSPDRSEDAVNDPKTLASEEKVEPAELPSNYQAETARNDLAGIPEKEPAAAELSSNASKDAALSQSFEASEEDVKQAELPSNTQAGTALNDLTGIPEKEPTAAEPSSNASKDIALSKPLEAPSEDVKAPSLSSHPSEETANVKSPDSPEKGLDQVNLKLELLMNRADSLVDTLTLDSKSHNISEAKKSQAASKADNMRTPTAQSTVSAKDSNKNRIAAKKQQQKQQQSATEQKKAGTKISTSPDPVLSELSPVKPLATSKPAAKQLPTSPMPKRDLKPLRGTVDVVQEWLPMPAPKERHALKVRRLGFADEPSPPPTFMSRMARMFGLGSKR